MGTFVQPGQGQLLTVACGADAEREVAMGGSGQSSGEKPKEIKKLWWTTCCPSCITDRIYYGWVILIVCTMGKIMSSPGQSPCIGPTTDAIMLSLGMTETKITTLYLFGTLASAFSLPQMGRVLDRVRPRKFIVGVSLYVTLAA